MPLFVSTMTFGDLLFLLGLIFYGGVSFAQLRTVSAGLRIVSARMERLEERVIDLTGNLQRVIGAFELHVRAG